MYEGTELQFVGFEDTDDLAAIQRALATLYSTPAGTCPGDRSFGIDWSFLDYPMDVAQNMYALEVIDKTAEYVPGVAVLRASIDWDMDGHMRAVVLVGPDDEGTDEDPEDEDED